MAEKKTRKEKRKEERKGQILEAALDIFSRKGYAAATIPEIARAAGVAVGTIYLYFPDKRELFIAAVKNMIITTPLLNLIDRMPSGNLEDVLKHILLNRFELLRNHDEAVARMPSMVGEILRDPELKELWRKEYIQPFLGRMEMAYRMMGVAGKIRKFEPAVLVRSIGGMVLGFLMLKVMEGEDSPVNSITPEEVAGNIVELILHGILIDANGETKERDRTK